MGTIVAEPTTSVSISERRRTDVSWGAIFAGWILAYGIAWLFFVLGSAMGLSAIDFAEENIAEGLGWSTVVWIVITWAASMYLGGLFAAWLTGNPDRSIGGMHGLAVWALATLLGLVAAGMTAANTVQATQSLLPTSGIGQIIGGGAVAATNGGAGTDQATTALQAQLKQALSEAAANAAARAGGTLSEQDVRRSIDQLEPATLATIAGQLLRGDTQAAENTLVINTPLSRSDVAQLTQGLSASVEQMQQRAREAADQAAKYTAAAMWALFFSSIIGLAMAAWGGWTGSRRVARRLGIAYTD